MKNLEIKAYCEDESVFDKFKSEGILDQTDTYYKCDNKKLKLREENLKSYKFIHYQREDEAKERVSNFALYPIDDIALFEKVFGGSLTVEVTVSKHRILYLYKHARIHYDQVLELPGQKFVEIEVLIRNEEEEKSAPGLMKELQAMLKIDLDDQTGMGYREMVLGKVHIAVESFQKY